MFKFLRFLFPSFGGNIPSTASYEKSLLDIERNYALFLEIQESDEFKRYLELKKYVESNNYKNDVARIKNLSYKSSREFTDEINFKLAKKSAEVKKFLKKGEGQDLPKVQEFIRLKNIISSAEFERQKKFLKNSNRHKTSDSFMKGLEYKKLAKSDRIKTFFNLQKKYSKQFAENEHWVSKLYDDFSKKQLDTSRWLSKPFWANVMLKGSYSSNNELQCTTDGNNLDLSNGTLAIATRNELADGLAWDNTFGFVPKQFNYTSGMVTTASTFRQQYGKFEAKVKISKANNVYHAFWMAADKQLPHLNIFKSEGNNVSLAAYSQQGSAVKQVEHLLKHKLNDGYYIYTLLWDEHKIIWQINGFKVFECNNFIDTQMYIGFSSGVTGDVNASKLPAQLEVDWVRCFRLK